MNGADAERGIPVLAVVCLVLYLMRRRSRLKSEE
jgi:hypothetical protein